MRCAIALGEIERNSLDLSKLALKIRAQTGHARKVCAQGLHGVLTSRAKAHDTDHVLGARAHAGFLSAAQRDGNQLFGLENFGADVQSTHALGAVDLMCADRHHVCTDGRGRKDGFHKALHRVTVRDDSGVISFCQREQRFEIVQRTGFVIDHHGADQQRALINGLLCKLHIKDTVLGGNADDLKAVLFQLLHDRLNRGMLACGGHDTVARSSFLGIHAAKNGQIVGLCARRGKIDLPRRAANPQSRRHLRTRLTEHPFGVQPQLMQRGGIAVALHSSQHGFLRLATKGCCGTVI